MMVLNLFDTIVSVC